MEKLEAATGFEPVDDGFAVVRKPAMQPDINRLWNYRFTYLPRNAPYMHPKASIFTWPIFRAYPSFTGGTRHFDPQPLEIDPSLLSYFRLGLLDIYA
jgi:hypothetical protein